MGFVDWLKRLFGRPPRIPDEIPEIVGTITDKDGRRHLLHRGPLQHETLNTNQLRRVARLRDVLIDAYPMTLDGWVDGFMRDTDPEFEIQIIEACAAVYQRLTTIASLSPDEKKRLYSVLCVLSAGGSGPKLASALPAGKGLPDLDGLATLYHEARLAGDRP